jgi:GxxExxY protein
LTEKIIAAAYAVHRELGFGFVEKVYKNALLIELTDSGFNCSSEVPMRAFYHEQVVGEFFADIVVENRVIVETKAVSKLDPSHEVQLVNYLKASGLNVGLLVNLGTSVEIKRKVF